MFGWGWYYNVMPVNIEHYVTFINNSGPIFVRQPIRVQYPSLLWDWGDWVEMEGWTAGGLIIPTKGILNRLLDRTRIHRYTFLKNNDVLTHLNGPSECYGRSLFKYWERRRAAGTQRSWHNKTITYYHQELNNCCVSSFRTYPLKIIRWGAARDGWFYLFLFICLCCLKLSLWLGYEKWGRWPTNVLCRLNP